MRASAPSPVSGLDRGRLDDLVRGRSLGMDGLREFLEAVQEHGLVAGNLRGLFHATIGRRISRPDGTVLSTGVTWRELAALLKAMRFDKDLVTEIGADPEELSPRDRQRFWYAAIALARPDACRLNVDRLAEIVTRQRLRHRGADGVVRADEEDGLDLATGYVAWERRRMIGQSQPFQ